MKTIEEIERDIDELPPDDFDRLSAWIAGRCAALGKDRTGASSAFRDHAAFLTSYVPEDEGLYDDAEGR